MQPRSTMQTNSGEYCPVDKTSDNPKEHLVPSLIQFGVQLEQVSRFMVTTVAAQGEYGYGSEENVESSPRLLCSL